jgi:CDP-diacylglycerol diphosphatase
MLDQRARPAARGAWRWRLAILGLALMTAGAASGIRALEVRAARPIELTHPHALWRVVHDLCVPDRRLLSLSAPCMKVSLAQGWAVVKDVRNPTHLLLVPTRRIIGIESPFLTTPDAPNYWAFAWNARPLFERLLGRPAPREDIGLVVNSRFGRTQDQLHIHMDLQTLVAVGATGPDGRPGFILLTGAAHPATGDAGVGEEILDHGCGILSAAHSR